MVDFVLASAKKSKSLASLEQSLSSIGISSAGSFAHGLWSHLPQSKASGGSSKAPKVKADAARYALLDMEDPSSSSAAGKGSNSSTDKIRKKEKKQKDKEATGRGQSRRRADDWDEDEEERAAKRLKHAQREAGHREKDHHLEQQPPGEPDQYEDLTEAERRELDYIQDQKERDEFAARLRERDNRRSKKVIEDRTSKLSAAAQARQKLADDQAAREAAMPKLRERSRQEYLTKREQQRLDLLRLEIADFEKDLRITGGQLTRSELKELERKKEVLRLAEEFQNIDDGQDGYVMPTDYITESGKIDTRRKANLIYKRYDDNKKARDQEQFVTDIDRFEEEQANAAAIRTGAQDREVVQEPEYDYVFDDAARIDWVLDNEDKIQGTMSVEEMEAQAQLDAAEARAKTIDQVRKSLPVYGWRDQLLEAVKEYQVLIIVGETGSGKTTQLPQYLHEAGYTKGGLKVGCTQPRRVAAMSVAARVAEEMGARLGQEVGYSIRFEDCTSDKTVVKYLTDGMLLREFLTEPDLAQYGCMIIDEAHERTLSTDILLGLVKDIARFRPDFRLLISSATMNAQRFSDFFDGAPIFNSASFPFFPEASSNLDRSTVPGRMYPVDLLYTPQPEANYLHAAVTTVFQIHTSQGKGDILVFLTGQDEIEACQESLEETARALGNQIKELIICPIYANLPTEMQSKIFEPTPDGARKVVLATNIAET